VPVEMMLNYENCCNFLLKQYIFMADIDNMECEVNNIIYKFCSSHPYNSMWLDTPEGTNLYLGLLEPPPS